MAGGILQEAYDEFVSTGSNDFWKVWPQKREQVNKMWQEGCFPGSPLKPRVKWASSKEIQRALQKAWTAKGG